MRFKVKKALYPHGTNNDSWQPMNLIVDDDIPCTEMQILFIPQSSSLSEASNCEKSVRNFV